ncbi:MAG: penicillin-binding protein 1C [Acidimicrobiales bacterium]|nr:penicillin-binding protein 1C [Hyphomonadaceae bacterium]RZV43620.1 MAG: penicillin-binding protein 1C [Acidimicrobiales bacterium]
MIRSIVIKLALSGVICAAAFCIFLGIYTVKNIQAAPDSFNKVLRSSQFVQVLDRAGDPLNVTYQNKWNVHDIRSLYEIPDFLKHAIVISEDKRFYAHNGPDWLARLAALKSNVLALRSVRGASTITEQCVRMLRPRRRTIGARWIEGFEAGRLEQNFSKNEILEFYLNQVPYTANRRGIAQAAHYYFDRDLDTLSQKEMLALIVLVRAPSRMDLWKDTKKVEGGIERLASNLVRHDVLTEKQKASLLAEPLDLRSPRLSVAASEFVGHVKSHQQAPNAGWPKIKTTLNANLQNRVQTLLDERLAHLRNKNVHNGAVLAIDHTNGEILAWVVAGKNSTDTPGKYFDAVTTPRQPGSALKPFLYALALEKGWTAATIIEDAPLVESVGHGLHAYKNYSRTFYGDVTLRQALGNSLNIPALKALQFVGAEAYLDRLHKFGFRGLSNHPIFYGDGIALGNGDVTLLELVEAYAAIANGGVHQPLTPFLEADGNADATRVMAPELASLLGLILSDPKARELEFGAYSVLNFPVQTAVKTGTSSDYRDSWAVGFNYRYTVGVWMGNLDQQPTDGLTGSVGPALLLRSVFSELNKHQETRPLPVHAKLVKRDICKGSEQANPETCAKYSEWFVNGSIGQADSVAYNTSIPIRLRLPVNGLHVAYDPRVPADSQAMEFHIQGISENDHVIWEINGEKVKAKGSKYVWPVKRGEHAVEATVFNNDQQIAYIEETVFLVK